jgi:hypothetical protein
LGIKIAASTVWGIPHEAGIDPAPQQTSQTWATFLRTQAEAILAADFFQVVTLTGARLHVLAVIEHASRRVRILGATAHPTAGHPTAGRVTQAAPNLAMDLDDARRTARHMIRDRDGKFPALFDAILADAGVKTVVWSAINENLTGSGSRRRPLLCADRDMHRHPTPVIQSVAPTTRSKSRAGSVTVGRPMFIRCG